MSEDLDIKAIDQSVDADKAAPDKSASLYRDDISVMDEDLSKFSGALGAVDEILKSRDVSLGLDDELEQGVDMNRADDVDGPIELDLDPDQGRGR